ncbi:MAG: hypothetical protein Q4Q53_05940 [Methanocorpusculum sp.]|nr:hypothetical protein [Methanocorpusculum sp.]
MTSIALESIAKRASEYTVIDRRNQISKICWIASETPSFPLVSQESSYIIC